jgi:hypothetical protein
MRLLLALAVLACASSLSAQTTTIRVQDSTTGAPVNIGDVDNLAARVALADAQQTMLAEVADAARDSADVLTSLSVPQTHDGTTASAPDLVGTAYEGKDFTGSAFANVISDADRYTRPAASYYGVQYVKVVGEDGSTDTLEDVMLKLDALLVAHDAADAGTSLKVGAVAIAHGTTPTAVAAADRTNLYANREGVPFVISGVPNTITLDVQVQDADGAQTNLEIVTCGAGCKVVVTRASMKCDGSNSAPVNAVIGFAESTLPSRAHTGATGIVAAFDGIPAGGGSVEGNGGGILGVGADGDDLLYTMEDPAGGNCGLSISYYTTAS